MVFGTRCRSAGTNDCGVNQPKIVAQTPVLFQLIQKVRKNFGPGAIATPTSKTAVNRLPATIRPWNIAPRSPGVQAPKDTIDDAIVIFKGSAAPAVVNSM